MRIPQSAHPTEISAKKNSENEVQVKLIIFSFVYLHAAQKKNEN